MDSKKLLVILAVVVVAVAAVAIAVSVTGEEEEKPSEPIPDDDTMGDLVVFGNANNDTVIDKNDLDYIQGVIDGKKARTPFSDANQDGLVDEKDLDQVKDMIDRKDGTKVYFIDAMNDIKSVEWPLNRIIALSNSPQIMALSVGLDEKVVGISKQDDFLYQNFTNAKLIAGASPEDYEIIFGLNPDAVIVGNSHNGGLETMHDPVVLKTYEKRGVDLISVYNMEGEKSGSSGLTLGYLCDTVEQATEYYNWCTDMFKVINETVDKIPDKDKHTGMVIFGGAPSGGSASGKTYDYTKALEAAGGINVITEFDDYKNVNADNGTWIFNYDPEYIFRISTIGYTNIIKDPNAGNPKYVTSSEKFAPMDAVKEGKFFLIDFSLPQTLRIAYMAECLYPDLFGVGFADEWHQKLINIYGLDFDVDGQFLVTAEDVKAAA